MIMHEITLDGYAVQCAERQIRLGTAGSYGVEALRVMRKGEWVDYDIIIVYHPPKGKPVKIRLESDNVVAVPPEVTAVAGTGELTFAGYADGVRQISVSQIYRVTESAGTEGIAPAEPTPELVQQILSAANGAVKTADGVREDMDKVLEAESERVTAETARAEAEAGRIAAEEERQSAEDARAKAETARESAETDRVISETDRKDAESKRANAEQERQTAEEGRVEAESSRVKAEAEREKQLPALKSSVDELQARQNILVGSETGNLIAVDDAFSAPLRGLTVYGKSTQDGTPTSDAPVPIVSAGDGGSVTVTLSDGHGKTQTLTLPTPNGLPGIPVTSGGNYTDPQSQQWVCDEVDLERGVKVQRVNAVDLSTCVITGTTNLAATKRLAIWLPLNGRDYKTEALCNKLQFVVLFTKDTPHFYVDGTNVQIFIPIDAKNPEEGEYILFYALATPIETPLTSAEIAAYKALTAYAPDTVVQASDGAGVKLAYQRDVNITIKKLEDAIASMTAT